MPVVIVRETMKDGRPSYYARNRSTWRRWLSRNAARKDFIWLIIYHQNGSRPSVYYNEAVEEALCFGWIDSKPNKRDSESYYLYFARRKPKSNWSKLNRERAAKMILSGKMTPAGQQAIDLAKERGTWMALDPVDNLIIPPDMKLLFKKNPVARKNFEAFSPSAKRGILEWILNAKRAETRKRRIDETIRLAALNVKANQYNPRT